MKLNFEFFTKKFDMDIPPELLPPQDKEIFNLNGILYSSKDLYNTIICEGDIFQTFIEKPRMDFYYMLGFWGDFTVYFYFSHIDPEKEVYFRIPYEGLYISDRKEKIKDFLNKYLYFERSLAGLVKKITVINAPLLFSFNFITFSKKKVILEEKFFESKEGEFKDTIDSIVSKIKSGFF